MHHIQQFFFGASRLLAVTQGRSTNSGEFEYTKNWLRPRWWGFWSYYHDGTWKCDGSTDRHESWNSDLLGITVSPRLPTVGLERDETMMCYQQIDTARIDRRGGWK